LKLISFTSSLSLWLYLSDLGRETQVCGLLVAFSLADDSSLY